MEMPLARRHLSLLFPAKIIGDLYNTFSPRHAPEAVAGALGLDVTLVEHDAITIGPPCF